MEACARGRARSAGRGGLPGPGCDSRCSLLQARRRGPQSPAAASSASARAGPVRPGRGSAVSPPGSGEYPAPCAPGCLDRAAQHTPLHPFQKTPFFSRTAAPLGGVHAPQAPEAGGARPGEDRGPWGGGDPRGAGSIPFSLTSLRRRRFGESWAPSGCVATCTGRVGVCPRAWKL